MNVIAYARFSPRPGAADCMSCDRQLADIRALCQAKGWTIRAEHSDPDTSGADKYRLAYQIGDDADGDPWITIAIKIKQRAGLSAAIRDLKRGDYLLVTAYDRLARDPQLATAYLEMIEGKGCKLVTVEGGAEIVEDPDQEMLRDIKWAIAKCERTKRGALTGKRMRQHQARGRKMGSKVPYGWVSTGDKVVETTAGSKRIIHTTQVEPEEQKIIAQIVELRSQGVGYREMARQLNDQGLRCRGYKWNHTIIRSILRREGEKALAG